MQDPPHDSTADSPEATCVHCGDIGAPAEAFEPVLGAVSGAAVRYGGLQDPAPSPFGPAPEKPPGSA